MEYKIKENSIITSINENYKKDHMIGLCIETTKGSIIICIDNDSQCCEEWGALFLETPDDITKVIGAKVLKVEDVNIELPPPEYYHDEITYESQLRITTSKGVLQYAVYNRHNGYYSHATFIQVFDTIETDCI